MFVCKRKINHLLIVLFNNQLSFPHFSKSFLIKASSQLLNLTVYYLAVKTSSVTKLFKETRSTIFYSQNSFFSPHWLCFFSFLIFLKVNHPPLKGYLARSAPSHRKPYFQRPAYFLLHSYITRTIIIVMMIK